VKFKIDENLPVEFIDLLKKEGWKAYSVFEEELGGARDEAIFNRCKKENLILITLDLDFANILKYPPKASPGLTIKAGQNSFNRDVNRNFTLFKKAFTCKKVMDC